MKVAIIMPYYNEVDLLRKSIQGIFEQTYKNWHLFLVDDGSERGKRSYEILDVPAEFNSKVTFVYKKNGGVSTARNTAINIITGDPCSDKFEAIAYCDSDDIWNKDYLERQVDVLMLKEEGFKGVDMVYVIPEHRFLDGTKAYPYGIPDFSAFPGLETLLKCNFIFISGVVHRIECLSVGFFDADLNSIEDWDYWVRICEAGYGVVRNYNTSFTYTVKQDGNGSRSNTEVYNKFHKKHAWLQSKYMSNA